MKAGDNSADADLLEQGLEKLGLPEAAGNSIPRNATVKLLWNYINEIERFNEAYGLVKVSSRRELIVKHILDSLAPLELIVQRLEATACAAHSAKPAADAGSAVWQIADVGSGAGLPGIPLAIILPGADFTLIERMGRRAGFLRNCIAVLGLSNVRVEEIDLEQAPSGKFDLAVFRAFRPLTPDILKGLINILKPDGFLAAWKGRLENARQEMSAVENSVPSAEIIPLTVPFLEEDRCLTVIEKICYKNSKN
jgi:16S rRNA (guanine527-N7)-methyltransferase